MTANWTPEHRLMRARVPAEQSDWLFDTGSLTQALIDHCAGRFSVRVLAQGRTRPTRDEARALSLPMASYALIREVHLMCDDQPLVFARSVIPHSTLIGPNRRLAHLGERPLGAFLFAQPQLLREEMAITRLLPGMRLFNHARRGLPFDSRPVWGRRSVFRLRERPLLVAEFFLPELFAGQQR